MERLTDKELNYILLYQRSCDDNRERGRARWYEIAERLRHIENLEEEIGCPSDIVFKALEIIVKKGVDIALAQKCKTTYEYNEEIICWNDDLNGAVQFWHRDELTQEEYDLVSKVVKEITEDERK